MQDHPANKTICFLTGASGVGKTTLVNLLEQKYTNTSWLFFHFDSIGVPSISDMQKEYGSGSGWQRAKTFEWIDRLVSLNNAHNIVIEGQVNLEFIREGFERHKFENYKIILIDCHEMDMGSRLTIHRKQPELFTPEMKKWREYLRRQAQEFQADIIDTSLLPPEEALKVLENILARPAK